jgi:hypothetical protein
MKWRDRCFIREQLRIASLRITYAVSFFKEVPRAAQRVTASACTLSLSYPAGRSRGKRAG